MSGESTTTTHAGLLKPIIEQGLFKVLPEDAIIQKLAPFKSGDKVGSGYEFLVELQRPHTHLWGGQSPSVASAVTAFQNGSSSRAVAIPAEYVGLNRIELATLSRSKSSGQAVQPGYLHFAETTRDSSRFALEVTSLHGGRMIAEVASLNSQVITVDRYAPAIIANLIGAKIDVYQSDGTTARQTGLVVTAVDPEASATTATITVTGTTTGIVDGDLVFFAGTLGGTSPGSQFGLFQQAAQTTGNLFSIAKTSPAWRSGSYAAGGGLTTAKVMEIAAKSTNRGNKGGRSYLFINPIRWASLSGLIAAQRSYDQSFSKSESINGVKAITIQCGNIEVSVVGHPYVFTTEGLLVGAEGFMRIGSADLMVGHPSSNNLDAAIYEVPATNAVELKTFADFQVVSKAQAHMILVTGITA